MSGSLQSRNVGLDVVDGNPMASWDLGYHVSVSGSVGSGHGGSDPILLPDGEASTGQPLAVAFLLVAPDLAQYGAESLVGDDGALRDVGVLVEEDSAGEPLVCVADLNASVLVLVYAAAFTREGQRLGPGLYDVHDPLVVESQVPRELAIILPGEDQIEVLVVTQGTVRVMRTQRFASESLVIVGTEF